MEKSYYFQSLIQVLSKETVMIHGNVLHVTFQLEAFKFKGVDFDQSYIPVSHDESFRINISIVVMVILTSRILDVIKYLWTKNVPIHEIVCGSLPPYYLDWFEKIPQCSSQLR